MAQHARPVGPASQNTAAAVSVEMFQGTLPAPKWNGYSTRTKGGHQVSQTTHVAAPFVPAMIEAARPQTPRLPVIARTGSVTPPDVTPFQFEMLSHARPHAPRPHRPTKGPSFFPWSGTAAPQFPDMTEGWLPDTNRARPPQRGSITMAPDVPAFSIEMVIGARPDRPRILLGPRIPLPVSQTTHIAAPFSADMVEGWGPDRHRYLAPFHAGGTAQTPDVPVFSIEMILASRPERPRLEASGRAATRGGWQVSQLTHVAAPFTADMVEGWQPDRQRYSAPLHAGLQWWPPDFDAFTIDMVQGSRPDRPRIFLAPRIPLPVSQTTHVGAPVSLEMLAGAAPGRHRYAAPLHQGVQWLTPDVAPFSIEMVLGSHPDSPRLPFVARQGQQVWMPEVEAFSIEMVQGAHPDRPRVLLGVRIAQPQSQTTQIDAPFSLEMTQGARPADRSHAFWTLKSGSSTPDYSTLITFIPNFIRFTLELLSTPSATGQQLDVPSATGQNYAGDDEDE